MIQNTAYIFVDLTFIWICVVVRVIVCVCVHIYVLFVLENCLLYAFAICVGELTVFSLMLLCCCSSEVCDTLVAVSVLLIISEIN